MPKIRAGELDIYFQLNGPAGGQPIVFIGGLGNDHHIWNLQVENFSKNFLCLTFDNRDVGQSEASPNPAYNIVDMARDTVELMRGLGIDRAHVVGFSMGGAIAQEVVLGWPELVGSLTLVSTFSKLETWGLQLFQKLGPLDNTGVERELFNLISPFAKNWRDFREVNFLGFVRDRLEGRPLYQSSPGYTRQLNATVDHDTTARLHQINVPTLVIVGEKDVVTPAAKVLQISQLIPNTKFALVEGASHQLPREKPDEFNWQLLEHLVDHQL